MLDYVFEFSDVSRVIVVDKHIQDLRGYTGYILAPKAVEAFDEVFDEKRDVLSLFAKRGQFQSHNIDAVVKVLPEKSLFNEVFEVLVRGGYDTHIRLKAFCSAEWFVCSFLQKAKQPNLKWGCDISNFVEKKGASFSEGKAAGLVLPCAGECTCLVTEKFGFEKRLRQGSAVHSDEGFL